MSTSPAGTLWVDGIRFGVSFERVYGVTQPQLWTAITTANQLDRWFVPISGDLRPGEQYELDFGDNGHGGGEIVSCEPMTGFVVTWQHENEVDSVLRVSLERVTDASTRLRLIHEGLPDAQAAGLSAGWHAYLDRLAALLSGDLLPDWDGRWQELRSSYRDQEIARRDA